MAENNKKNDKYTPNGYCMDDVVNEFKRYQDGRQPHDRTWKQLDAYDSGHFWEVLKKRLPPHQIICDTNYTNYVKQNIVNSLYTGPYIADVSARFYEHKEHADKVNAFVEYVYNKVNIPYKQLQAGDRAALNNVAYLQFGWDADHIDKITKRYKGDIAVTMKDTLEIYLDPSYTDLQEGKAVMIAGEDSISDLKMKYPERMKEYGEKVGADSKTSEFDFGSGHSQEDAGKGYYGQYQSQSDDRMLQRLTVFWKYTDEDGKFRIDQIETVGTDYYVLEIKEDIKPKYFPIVALYGLPPVKDPYGTSVLKLIMKNILTINLLDSLEATYIYASQKRATIMKTGQGLNAHHVAKNINNPDRIITTSGNPADVIHQLDLPLLPQGMQAFRDYLVAALQMVTGIDMKYTGRDTGSVTTTGGMEAMQERVSLTDNTRITMLEQFALQVTKMIVDFYVEFGGKREVNMESINPVHSEIYEIDFDLFKGVDSEIRFEYTIDASPFLPKNRARYAEAANIIMEKQMQYQAQPQLMSPEEWLSYQDFPQKDIMLDRMRGERFMDDLQQIQGNIVNFSSAVQQGMRPEAAVDMLAQEQQAMRDNPKLGNVGGAPGMAQAAQAGPGGPGGMGAPGGAPMGMPGGAPGGMPGGMPGMM